MADTDSLIALLGQLAAGAGGGEKSENSRQNAEGGADGGADGGKDSDDGIFGDIDLETIMKLMDAFSQLSSTDKNTQLLLAIKPHLKNENRSKVDKAIKLMKLMSVFMLLRESGLTDKIL